MMQSFYLSRFVYHAGFGAAALFGISYFFPPFFILAIAVLLLLMVAIIIDTFLLYNKTAGVQAVRTIGERLSNGDENAVKINLENHYSFPVTCLLIDELPYQFQERNWHRKLSLKAHEKKDFTYIVKPQQRGEYDFGNSNAYINSPLRMVIRRYTFQHPQVVKVYPSYVQMRRYQLLAVSNHLQESGVKRIRKLGHSLEFEQIKEYVRGDDYRTINWKATARHSDLMVNNYTDERSQQIYCLINKGRVMKMPFAGMTLLDYAINTTLTLSNIALLKQDKAGLITFGEQTDTFLPADKKPGQLSLLLESLYKQDTAFLEPDFEQLFSVIRSRITQRSLLVLFTNFESVESLQRELSFLKRIAHYHLLMVVFFENTELKQLTESKAATIEDIYIKTIANKYQYEKRLMVKELQQQGIVAVLTTPHKLTINAINKYLELKNRQSI